MATLTINESLHLNYVDERELLNMLLEIYGFTKKEFAEKFELTEDAVNNWNRKDREVPEWVLIYLMDTLELELRLIGYVLKVKKMASLTKELRDVQDNITNLRLEKDIKQSPLHLNIGDLIVDDVFINLGILNNCKDILEDFYKKNK
jgi:hypothetical protein